MSNEKKVFSGIKPSGSMHIGNYLGAISQWVNFQDDFENIFCVVDLHAITTPISPELLNEQTRSVAAWYLAAGIDPNKSTIFVQSHNPDHAQLAWILNCYTSMGQMNRMTQYKDKKDSHGFTSVGLFDYPVLMAADILLYDADLVPVGEDQKQHVELTRDLADRFNSQYGETFTSPEYMEPPTGKRVMSLQHPDGKMSKSEKDIKGTIYLEDSAEVIRKKIMSAQTDTGDEVLASKDKPAVSNLIDIYTSLSDVMPEELDAKYSGKGYKQFKEDLAEVVINTIMPLQEKYNEIINSPELDKVLQEGVQKAQTSSQKKLSEVQHKVGFYFPS